jgi:pilus assembly protein TadC
MNSITVLIVAFGILLTGGAGFLFFYLSKNSEVKNIIKAQREGIGDFNKTEDVFQKTKDELLKKKKKVKEKPTEEGLLFQAGIITPEGRKKFYRLKTFAPIIGAIVLGYGGTFAGGQYILMGAVMGLLVGLQIPKSMLERKIAARSEDIMFYLPLVVEQVAIGVSSSLDIGPCLQKVVSMADERDSHNVVTEYLRMVTTLARSGLSLETALNEVAKRSGHLELGQTFGAMAQVLKHGGEITKQLQEMADAVSSQRETKIEAKIKKLELEATGPVAMVFMGFLLILLTCIGMQMMKAFV